MPEVVQADYEDALQGNNGRTNTFTAAVNFGYIGNVGAVQDVGNLVTNKANLKAAILAQGFSAQTTGATGSAFIAAINVTYGNVAFGNAVTKAFTAGNGRVAALDALRALFNSNGGVPSAALAAAFNTTLNADNPADIVSFEAALQNAGTLAALTVACTNGYIAAYTAANALTEANIPAFVAAANANPGLLVAFGMTLHAGVAENIAAFEAALQNAGNLAALTAACTNGYVLAYTAANALTAANIPAFVAANANPGLLAAFGVTLHAGNGGNITYLVGVLTGDNPGLADLTAACLDANVAAYTALHALTAATIPAFVAANANPGLLAAFGATLHAGNVPNITYFEGVLTGSKPGLADLTAACLDANVAAYTAAHALTAANIPAFVAANTDAKVLSAFGKVLATGVANDITAIQAVLTNAGYFNGLKDWLAQPNNLDAFAIHALIPGNIYLLLDGANGGVGAAAHLAGAQNSMRVAAQAQVLEQQAVPNANAALLFLAQASNDVMNNQVVAQNPIFRTNFETAAKIAQDQIFKSMFR